MRRFCWLFLILLSLLILFVGRFPACAQRTAVSITSATTGVYAGESAAYTHGFQFVPKEDITVNALGCYDYQGDGLASDFIVGIFDSSGTLLASTIVPSGTGASLTDGFRYVGISPLHLSAGQIYTAAARAKYAPDTLYAVLTNLNANPSLTLPDHSGVYNGGADFQFPTSYYRYQAYLGPNFKFIGSSDTHLFISGYGSSSVREYTTSGEFVREFVSAGSGGLSGPGNLRFGPDGNLYVTSGGNGAIKKYDGITGAYLGDFATGLSSPADIVFDSAGNAYIAEYSVDRVSKFSKDGVFLQSYTSNISTPEGLAVRPNNNVLVANTYSGPYRNTLTEIDALTGTTSAFATGLGEPVGIARGPDGRYYVGNYTFAYSYGGTNPDTIQVVPADGGVSTTFNSGGSLYGTEYLVFLDGTLYVTSYYNSTVQVFDGTTGNFIRSFSLPSGFGVSGIAVRNAVSNPADGPPDTSILSGPADGGFACDSSVTFGFTGFDDYTQSANLRYQHRVDSGTWSSPSSDTSVLLTGLADGTHTFEVAAIDEAGHVDATPDSHTFQVITVPPAIANVRTTNITATTAIIQWDTDKAAMSQVDYRVQGETAWTSTVLDISLVTAHTVILSGLKPNKTYEYRARSADVCVHETITNPATFMTQADTSAPDTSITSGPTDGGKACEASVSFAWTGQDDATETANLQYQYQLDGGAWSAWASDTQYTFSSLTEGTHTFAVRARDEAGNTDATPAARTFFVDLTAPTLSNISASPRDYRATIQWNTSEPTTAQVEYGPDTNYGSVTPLDSNMDGAHQVVLRNLTPRTTYHYRVKSSDGCREVVSDDQSFTTTDILKPNLIVSDVQFPAQVTPRATINVTWTVQNNGPGDTQQAWSDSLYLSDDNQLDANDAPLGSFNANNLLEDQGSYTVTHSIALPFKPAGTYYLILKADSDNALTEGNEDDNTLAKPVEFLKVSSLIATPDQIALSLHPGVPVQGQLDLNNLSDQPLTGLVATVEGAAGNINVQVSLPDRINPLEPQKADYTVTASDESVLQNAPVIHLTSAEGEQAQVTLNLTVIPNRPQLVVTPGSLSAGMVRGQQALVECEIANTGSVAATGLKVSLPGASWLSLVTPENMADIPPGEKAKIVLSLMPSKTQALGPYTGNIAVNGTNAGASIGFTFNCVSSGKGDVKITAEDEFTYFADTHPNVAGAKITITDVYTGVVVADGVTDSGGIFEQQGIPEGTYNLEATADKHSTSHAVIKVVAGQKQETRAFLQRELVTYKWTVVSVDTPDHYAITLEAVFETHVPAPVVTISPVRLELAKLSYDASGKAVVYYTVTNHGLIAANDVNLTFGQNPNYQVTPAIEKLGKLDALTTIVVPVTITKIQSIAPAGSGAIGAASLTSSAACFVEGIVRFIYDCGGAQAGMSRIWLLDECHDGGGNGGVPPPTNTGSDSSGGGGGGGGSGGGGSIIPQYSSPQDVQQTSSFCDPCTQRILDTALRCLAAFAGPLPCAVSGIGALISIINHCQQQPRHECASIILDAITKLLRACGYNVGLGPKISCALLIVSTIKTCLGQGGAGGGGGSGGGTGGDEGGQVGISAAETVSSPALAYLELQIARLQSIAALFTEIYGDPVWLNTPAEEEQIMADWITGFQNAIDPDSSDGSKISDSERTALLAQPRPSLLTEADITKMLDRWNRTQDYYAADILTEADVPAGQSTDFIDYDRVGSKIETAGTAAQASMDEGFMTIYDGVQKAMTAVTDELLQPKEEGVCARVRIRLSQDAILTRSVFKATLEITNAPQNVNLENVKVTLDIRNGDQQPSNSVFALSNPILAGIDNVNGTGVIPSGTTAKAEWEILPTRDAAPDGPTAYYVGGELSYMQDGTEVTVPLFPSGILVKPDPFLKFHYFWQRDVYSDDPFTALVEPAEPFALGLLVENRGKGSARNMTIASSQPQIVDNEKGLLIGFKILGSQVNDQPVAPSLTVNLGDIAPDDTATAAWWMTSSLQGKFIEYSATFKHVDGLGNPRTSLLDSVDIHELEHIVRVDVPDDDKKPDFLANDVPDTDKLPDTLWLSDGTTAPVSAITDASVDGPVTDTHLTVQLTAASVPGGFVYIRTDDPAQGRYKLLKVLRSDGREVKLDQDGGGNAWTTHRVIRLQGQTPFPQHRLYLFDKDSTGSYTLLYGQLEPARKSAGGSKTLANGLQISTEAVVTAAFADGLYVEALDRSGGIKVVSASAPEGHRVTVTGTLRTGDNGERYVEAQSVTDNGTGTVAPLGIGTKALYGGDFYYDSATGAGQQGMDGGLGLNPVGLLVSTLGKVTEVGSGYFRLDDGYGRPVKALLPDGVPAPTQGSFVGLDAIVSIEKVGGKLLPLLRPRRSDDLAYNPDASLLQAFVAPLGTLAVDWNLLSLPGVPTRPAPPSVFSQLDPGDGSSLSGRLSRYDAGAQSEVFFDATQPALFGNMLLGEGYRLRLNAGEKTALGFSGYRADFADRWISVPKLGAVLFGHPFPFAVHWALAQVTDGFKTVTLEEAVKTEFPPWLNSVAKFFDNTTQQERTLGLASDSPDSELLLPWFGYWLTSYRDNLALIIPMQAVEYGLFALHPSAAASGGPGFTLTVVGSGFVEGATVYWNGHALATTYHSSTELSASVPAVNIALPGQIRVTVLNPAIAGGQFNDLIFTIWKGVPGKRRPGPGPGPPRPRH